MVKTVSSSKKASSSKPNDDNFKFSHSIYLKTEKIIKFAKALQDFIILQHKEILDYCAQQETNNKSIDTNKMDFEEIEEIPPISNAGSAVKRKPGRPKKDAVPLTEVKPKKKNPPPSFTEINPNQTPRLIKIGRDNNGKPLYQLVSSYKEGHELENSVGSSKSVPNDLIRKLDEYILNEEDKNYQKTIEEDKDISSDNDEDYQYQK